MASTVKPLIEKISERHLECQICKDCFKEPRLLKCSHSYCLGCLQQLAQEQSQDNEKITCPVCRGETSLHSKQVSDLQCDFKLSSLLDEIKQHETELQSQQKSQPPTQESVSKCSAHTDKNLILFCHSCDKFICISCLCKAHRMHELADMREILEIVKQKANEIYSVIEKQQTDFKTANQEIVSDQKNADDRFANNKKQITKKADEDVARIRKEEQKVKMEIKQRYKDSTQKRTIAKATNNEQMAKAQNKKDEFTKLLTRGSSCENLLFLRKLLQDLKKETELKPTDP